jgi:hypothetical protein
MSYLPLISKSKLVRFFALMLAVCLMAAPAMADKAKKSHAPTMLTTKPTNAGLVYGSPLQGVMEATLHALGQTAKLQGRGTTPVTPRVDPAKTQLLNRDGDTARRDNRIVQARANNDVFVVKVELLNDESSLDVGIYNMLGKKVHDVYRGSAARGTSEYTAPVSDLPEGVYICVVQGTDFRRAEKFYLSR